MICATIVLINLSTFVWNSRDTESFLHAQQTCNIRYKGCITKFIKKDKQVYNILCKKKSSNILRR